MTPDLNGIARDELAPVDTPREHDGRLSDGVDAALAPRRRDRL